MLLLLDWYPSFSPNPMQNGTHTYQRSIRTDKSIQLCNEKFTIEILTCSTVGNAVKREENEFDGFCDAYEGFHIRESFFRTHNKGLGLPEQSLWLYTRSMFQCISHVGRILFTIDRANTFLILQRRWRWRVPWIGLSKAVQSSSFLYRGSGVARVSSYQNRDFHS